MCRHSLHRSEGPDRHNAIPGSRRSEPQPFAKTTFLSALSVAKVLVLAVCCVVFCLAFSEFPETLSLSDDTSNDFVVVNDSTDAIDSEMVETTAIQLEATYPASTLALSYDASPLAQASFRAPDLLSLISLRRI
jgi:hypothetical protein